jgi:NADH:ubiquinone reductase (H+-translocating)
VNAASAHRVVIVGRGATGVELAGANADLAHVTIPDEFRHIETRKTRVLLIKAGPRILRRRPG